MRIAYCTNIRLPSERAHGHQIAQVCDALVRLGHEVTIFCPYRDNPITEDYHTYYRAESAVNVEHLGSYDYIQSPLFPGVLGLWTMNIQHRRNLTHALKQGSYDLVYTRNVALLQPLIQSNIDVVLELHQLPVRDRNRFVTYCNQCKTVAALTSSMKEELLRWGVKPERVVVEGDAVDLRRFIDPISQQKAREHFGVATDRLVVGYIGRLKTLGMEKGVKTILEGLKQLADTKQFFGLIVGGPDDDQQEYEALAATLGLTKEDVHFTGSIPAHDIPSALWACDVLAMPWPDLPHYRTHMSPLKMFEYMAANRPIITGDLPTIRDVLDEKTALFCQPDSTDSFVECLKWMLHNPSEAQQIALTAKQLVDEHYSWEKRMERVLLA